eukprot:jgi/Chlat1/3148/Chrsp21S00246
MQEGQQELLYDTIGKPLVDNALAGCNGSLMAYGQTGAGKTFSMYGELAEQEAQEACSLPRRAGLIPRMCNGIFQQLNSSQHAQVEVSCYEVYEDQVFDLLSAGKCGAIWNMNNTSPRVECNIWPVCRQKAASYNDMLKMLAEGMNRRSTAETTMNAHSSRSHTFFHIFIKQQQVGRNLASEILLVDLAGTSNGVNLVIIRQEADGINVSLTCLGRVIDAKRATSATHVPFGDSVLTKLLAPALEGNSKTHLLAAVSPASTDCQETLCTLRFAHRAREVKTAPKANIIRTTCNADVKEAYLQVAKLQQQLETSTADKQELQQQLEASLQTYQQCQQQLEASDAEKSELERQLDDCRQHLRAQSQQPLAEVLEKQTLQLADCLNSAQTTPLQLHEDTHMYCTPQPSKVENITIASSSEMQGVVDGSPGTPESPCNMSDSASDLGDDDTAASPAMSSLRDRVGCASSEQRVVQLSKVVAASFAEADAPVGSSRPQCTDHCEVRVFAEGDDGEVFAVVSRIPRALPLQDLRQQLTAMTGVPANFTFLLIAGKGPVSASSEAVVTVGSLQECTVCVGTRLACLRVHRPVRKPLRALNSEPPSQPPFHAKACGVFAACLPAAATSKNKRKRQLRNKPEPHDFKRRGELKLAHTAAGPLLHPFGHL